HCSRCCDPGKRPRLCECCGESRCQRIRGHLRRGGVSVIDSNTSVVVRTGAQPVAVAVHEYTGTTYVANNGSASVTVIQPADPQPVKNDFNGDRNADVLARDGSGGLWLYPGDGAAGWLDRRQVGQGWNIMTALLASGGFKGDGKADILARDNTGVLWLYGGNGKGGWLTRVQIGSGWSGMTDILGVGDFNTDGASDVAARDSSGRLWLYPGNGAGGWLPQVQYGQGWNGMTAMFGPGD